MRKSLGDESKPHDHPEQEPEEPQMMKEGKVLQRTDPVHLTCGTCIGAPTLAGRGLTASRRLALLDLNESPFDLVAAYLDPIEIDGDSKELGDRLGGRPICQQSLLCGFPPNVTDPRAPSPLEEDLRDFLLSEKRCEMEGSTSITGPAE